MVFFRSEQQLFYMLIQHVCRSECKRPGREPYYPWDLNPDGAAGQRDSDGSQKVSRPVILHTAD